MKVKAYSVVTDDGQKALHATTGKGVDDDGDDKENFQHGTAWKEISGPDMQYCRKAQTKPTSRVITQWAKTRLRTR